MRRYDSQHPYESYTSWTNERKRIFVKEAGLSKEIIR